MIIWRNAAQGRQHPRHATGGLARPAPGGKRHGRNPFLTRMRRPAVVLVCGGMILMLALGIRQNFGLFLRPMSFDLGGGRATFSYAIALQNLVWGLGMRFACAIADRSGDARGLVAGALASGRGPC